MPELPDITVYIDALTARVIGQTLERFAVRGPSVLRTFDPAPEAAEGKRVIGVERLGKRIILALEDELFIIVHLMIAGRLRWEDASGEPPGKPNRIELARWRFPNGTLILTEAATKKRASIHVARGRAALAALDPGGLDVLTCTPGAFSQRLLERNSTLKRALTDPRRFDGIGNAYSDEILHAAGLSPLLLTSRLTSEQSAALLDAARATLLLWVERLRAQFGVGGGKPGKFPGPGEITAFRPDFAVHGKFGQACPVCGTSVQRILSADNECNYCPRCQTNGKMLADRAMSRLLGDDWPRTIEEWEGTEGPA